MAAIWIYSSWGIFFSATLFAAYNNPYMWLCYAYKMFVGTSTALSIESYQCISFRFNYIQTPHTLTYTHTQHTSNLSTDIAARFAVEP